MWEEKECLSDAEGRWLIVKGRCFAKDFTLATIYAPNTGQTSYLCQFIEKVVEVTEGTLVIGGDWNVAMDPELDVSHGRPSLSHRGIKSLKRKKGISNRSLAYALP